MCERNEILESLKHLNNCVNSEDKQSLNDKSDLELLRILLKNVKSQRISERLDDSLAFPSDIRNDTNLTNATDLWNQLDQFNANLNQDFTCRRQMLLQRLDCTVESFKWKGTTTSHPDKVRHEPLGGAGKSMNDRIHDLYERSRVTMREEPKISISDLLAARARDCDKSLNVVVSSKSVDHMINYSHKKQSTRVERVNLKQVIIPHVPDRGGRTEEMRPPAKESFSQQRGGLKRGRG